MKQQCDENRVYTANRFTEVEYMNNCLGELKNPLQVILVPSAFTTVTGDAHWEILLRSRAIETQCYVCGLHTFSLSLTTCSFDLIDLCSIAQVIAASQAGKHNEKRESYGDTLIIDPWGSVVGRLPGEDLVLICYNSF